MRQTEQGEERRDFDDGAEARAYYEELVDRFDVQFVQLFDGEMVMDWELTLTMEAGDRAISDPVAAVAVADALRLPTKRRQEFLDGCANAREMRKKN